MSLIRWESLSHVDFAYPVSLGSLRVFTSHLLLQKQSLSGC